MSNYDQRLKEAVDKAFNKGFESKRDEIKEMGWVSARNKFNADYPPGKPLPEDMSAEGRAFAFGEYEAIDRYAE